MSKLSRLIGMASKALDKNGRPQGANPGAGSDWRSIVRSAADSLTSAERPAAPAAPDPYAPSPGRYAPPAASGYSPPPAAGSAPSAGNRAGSLSAADRQAIARYDYLLQTADPQQIESIHRDAFARLSPEQRAHVEARMRAELPPHEAPRSSDPADLARTAARTEASRPGMLRGLLARAGGAGSRGGRGGLAAAGIGAAGGLLAGVAGGAIVGGIAGPLLAQAAGFGVDFDALAGSLDVEGLAGGVEGIAGEATSEFGEQIGGLGEQVTGFGDQLDGFDLGGLFGR